MFLFLLLVFLRITIEFETHDVPVVVDKKHRGIFANGGEPPALALVVGDVVKAATATCSLELEFVLWIVNKEQLDAAR